MAKNDSDPLGPAGATMFLAPMDTPGIKVERVLDTLDQYMAGGHGVVSLDDVRVPESAVLGRVGEGFRYAQARLAPARLTHCMRWLGAARRAHDIATDYARTPHRLRQAARRARGGRVHARRQRDGLAHLPHDDLAHAPGCSTRASAAATNSSMAKVICSEAIWRVVDRSMQVLGGLGITDDTIVARLFREVRPFRIYDGPVRGPPLVDRPAGAAGRDPIALQGRGATAASLSSRSKRASRREMRSAVASEASSSPDSC